MLSWKKGAGTKKFIVYKLRRNKPADLSDPENIIYVTSETALSVPLTKDTDLKKYYFVITSVSNTNAESDPVLF